MWNSLPIYIKYIFLLESLAILFRLCLVLGIPREEKLTVDFNLVQAHVLFLAAYLTQPILYNSVIQQSHTGCTSTKLSFFSWAKILITGERGK